MSPEKSLQKQLDIAVKALYAFAMAEIPLPIRRQKCCATCKTGGIQTAAVACVRDNAEERRCNRTGLSLWAPSQLTVKLHNRRVGAAKRGRAHLALARIDRLSSESVESTGLFPTPPVNTCFFKKG